jgi:hypothetical protein
LMVVASDLIIPGMIHKNKLQFPMLGIAWSL